MQVPGSHVLDYSVFQVIHPGPLGFFPQVIPVHLIKYCLHFLAQSKPVHPALSLDANFFEGNIQSSKTLGIHYYAQFRGRG